jgi:uncharacterized protein
MQPITLNLTLLAGNFAILKLPAIAAVPVFALAAPWFSITRTQAELSLVCSDAVLPATLPDDAKCELGWSMLPKSMSQ